MSGVAGYMNIGYMQGDDNYVEQIGTYVDGVFAANAANIEIVDLATERVTLNDPNLKIYGMDSNGTTYPTRITGVVRVTVANLPAFQTLQFQTNSGIIMQLGSLTPVATRVNNVIDGKTAGQYQIGDMICCSLLGMTRDTQGTWHQIQYRLNPSMPIPGVISMTWGELTISRYDAASFVQVCESYPDAVDPGDKAIFEAVLNEMTVYDAIVNIIDHTSAFTNIQNLTKLYWIETETNCFNLLNGSPVLGTPIPGPIYAPLSQDKVDEIRKSKGTSATGEVLKTFHKEQNIDLENPPKFEPKDE